MPGLTAVGSASAINLPAMTRSHNIIGGQLECARNTENMPAETKKILADYTTRCMDTKSCTDPCAFTARLAALGEENASDPTKLKLAAMIKLAQILGATVYEAELRKLSVKCNAKGYSIVSLNLSDKGAIEAYKRAEELSELLDKRANSMLATPIVQDKVNKEIRDLLDLVLVQRLRQQHQEPGMSTFGGVLDTLDMAKLSEKTFKVWQEKISLGPGGLNVKIFDDWLANVTQLPFLGAPAHDAARQPEAANKSPSNSCGGNGQAQGFNGTPAVSGSGSTTINISPNISPSINIYPSSGGEVIFLGGASSLEQPPQAKERASAGDIDPNLRDHVDDEQSIHGDSLSPSRSRTEPVLGGLPRSSTQSDPTEGEQISSYVSANANQQNPLISRLPVLEGYAASRSLTASTGGFNRNIHPTSTREGDNLTVIDELKEKLQERGESSPHVSVLAERSGVGPSASSLPKTSQFNYLAKNLKHVHTSFSPYFESHKNKPAEKDSQSSQVLQATAPRPSGLAGEGVISDSPASTKPAKPFSYLDLKNPSVYATVSPYLNAQMNKPTEQILSSDTGASSTNSKNASATSVSNQPHITGVGNNQSEAGLGSSGTSQKSNRWTSIITGD
ncbi:MULTISPECIES: hypothetical protein [Pseudomonas]|uniref:Uncharacterized protein n=1 Tax=Pseudomonas quercus TaxID=2722792 RepID=A0ABX0YBT1_9PSED|nr:MULTISPECIES: hypothetical protein [Pseudomonas]MBF7141018.1 hypothetical protein [Pseudomonas sp. LY10J]NJO99552.1 hypothetical protein [Pseudomonas quercus]